MKQTFTHLRCKSLTIAELQKWSPFLPIVFAFILLMPNVKAQRISLGIEAYYSFNEGSGNVIYDQSGNGLHLLIDDTDHTNWVNNGCGLEIVSSTIIKNIGNANHLKSALQSTNAITIEAWIKPNNLTQNGPARIVTFSKNTSSRNFTLGQENSKYALRLKTSSTSANGMPNLNSSSNKVTTNIQHVVYTRNSSGSEKIYIDGALVKSGNRGGNFSNWSDFDFALANEITGDRPWLGTIFSTAIYSRDLNSSEINQNYISGYCPDSNSSISDLVLSDSWMFQCGENKIVDNYGFNANCNNVTVMPLTDTQSIFQYGVEIIYKDNNPGDVVYIEDAEGNSHPLMRDEIYAPWKMNSYRGIISGSTSTLYYTDNSTQCNLQSIEIYAFRNDSYAGASGGQWISKHGYNNIVNFSIDIPTNEEVRDIDLIVPISEMTTDGRYLMIVAEAGGVSQTQFVYGPDPSITGGTCCLTRPQFMLANVPGSADKVNITIDSRHRKNGQNVNGQSWVASGLVHINMECGESFIYGCEDRYDFEWSDGLGNGATWDLTNGETAVTRSYTVAGINGGSLNVDVSLSNPTGSAIDESNCGSDNFYLATCDADFAGSACGSSYTNFGCGVLTFSKSTSDYDDNVSITYAFDSEVKLSDLKIGGIDFKSTGTSNESYHNDITITANLNGTAVPIEATQIGNKLLVTGNQSINLNVVARYQPMTDGRIAYSDVDGQVTIETMGLVNSITISYKNGEADKMVRTMHKQ